ncbi:hypothetical protein [Actinomadura kijaniata]|uniref:hypothetical protein n=1 Tax=Actinomadura kijaniata TaxID=46161 RepID=UPI000832B092|nr:hypothetical protein [Actinomadura kijaniata]
MLMTIARLILTLIGLVRGISARLTKHRQLQELDRFLLLHAQEQEVEIRVFLNPNFLNHWLGSDTSVLHEALRTTGPADRDPVEHCEDMFIVLNVGHDPEHGEVDPRAVGYRRAGHRSLSVGDVVAVGDQFFQCESTGWNPIPPPPAAITPAA